MYAPRDSISLVRRSVRLGALLTLLVVAVAACSETSGSSGTSPEAETSAPAGGETRTVEKGTASGAEATVRATSPEETAGGPARFVKKPVASGGARYGADSILAVRHGVHGDYERVVVDLGVGDEPARKVPAWDLMRLSGGGLLRVTFPSVSATGVSDGPLGGDALLDRFYVVRAPEEGMFVDVFARQAFAYRVVQLEEPARLVVDFRPADGDSRVNSPVARGRTVLLEPESGARVDGPLTVSGYSRNFEATNTAVLQDERGETLARQTFQANDWTSTWGYFETTLHPPPLRGAGVLLVGAKSARDGAFEGVEVPVRGG